MAASKQLSLDQALSRFVFDGQSLLLGAALEALIPFAAAEELIRQGRRRLTLAAPISDMLIDLMVGAGTTERVLASWVGNVSAGSGYNFRRAIEEQEPVRLEMVDYSNLTFALALHAAALGVPYLPTRSVLGTDLLAENTHLIPIRCPFTAVDLVAVEAFAPDVAILAVQRADAQGNGHLWGNTGVTVDAARAAKSVVLLAEEIVSEEIIASDPNRTLVPGFLVSAVVEAPMGCHPSPCQGYYRRDHDFFHDYHRATRSRGGFLRWLEQWVQGCPDHQAYLERLGTDRLDGLKVTESALTAPANFGI